MTLWLFLTFVTKSTVLDNGSQTRHATAQRLDVILIIILQQILSDLKISVRLYKNPELVT